MELARYYLGSHTLGGAACCGSAKAEVTMRTRSSFQDLISDPSIPVLVFDQPLLYTNVKYVSLILQSAQQAIALHLARDMIVSVRTINSILTSNETHIVHQSRHCFCMLEITHAKEGLLRANAAAFSRVLRFILP